MRTALCCLLISAISLTCLADKLILKDGTTREVRLYKVSEDYVSFVADGRLAILPRDKIKDIVIEGEPLSEEELTDVIKKTHEEQQKKVRQEEKKAGIKSGPAKAARTTEKDASDKKGVSVIKKEKSDTEATELRIDPFPEHPTEKKPAPKEEARQGDKK